MEKGAIEQMVKTLVYPSDLRIYDEEMMTKQMEKGAIEQMLKTLTS